MRSSVAPSEYDRAVGFLLERINYERALAVPYGDRTFKLERMRDLLEALGNPQTRVPAVHIAGTKGKGSTAAMTAAILSAAGYRVGLYSSPHLERVEERLVIDGPRCSEEELIDLLDRARTAVEKIDRESSRAGAESGPTYFDILTAVAFLYFAQQQVDLAVLEVGLGGRLDSTNVCHPLVSVITSISFDHMAQLGTTLTAIAAEKAGIIKPSVPVVSGVVDEEPRQVIRDAAERAGSKIVELGQDFFFRYEPPEHLERAALVGRMDYENQTAGANQHYRNMELALLGRHQAANAAVALATCAQLSEQSWKVDERAARQGLAEVRWPARVEVLSRKPAIVLDAAHNVASLAALLKVLEESFAPQRQILIFATTLDKDVQGMLRLVTGRFDEVIFTRYLNNPRALAPEHLASLAAETCGLASTVAPTPLDAWQMACARLRPDHLLAVTGSFFIAAEMRGVIEADRDRLRLAK